MQSVHRVLEIALEADVAPRRPRRRVKAVPRQPRTPYPLHPRPASHHRQLEDSQRRLQSRMLANSRSLLALRFQDDRGLFRMSMLLLRLHRRDPPKLLWMTVSLDLEYLHRSLVIAKFLHLLRRLVGALSLQVLHHHRPALEARHHHRLNCHLKS